MLADELEVDDGPLVGWPLTGLPVAGSICTKSGALLAEEEVCPEQPPPLTVQSALEEEPRRCGETEVSNALVWLEALPPQFALLSQSTVAEACETLTGPDTLPATGLPSAPSSGSRLVTWVSLLVSQPPPTPCASHAEAPLLSRVPLMSPDAAPVVAECALPLQSALAQS